MKGLRFLCILVLVGMFAAGCGAPAARPAPAQPREPAAAQPPPQEAPAAPAADAAKTEGGQPAGDGVTAAAGQLASLDQAAISPYQGSRKIIKNGEMALLVTDTDRAIDQVTGIAVDAGGYVISQQTEMQDGFKNGTLNLGVPVDRFEDVQRRLRALALSVIRDVAEGKDVTDEYVDLQSRLTNQEATAARVREFLSQAKTVEEALKVNQQLSEIEDEIEKIKGRMNYLKDRSAFSTLKVDLEPQRPTPTPTPTPTPMAWRPGETFNNATTALGTVSRGMGNLLIWLVVLLGPFIVAAAVIYLIVRQIRPRRPRRAETPPPAAPAAGN